MFCDYDRLFHIHCNDGDASKHVLSHSRENLYSSDQPCLAGFQSSKNKSCDYAQLLRIHCNDRDAFEHLPLIPPSLYVRDQPFATGLQSLKNMSCDYDRLFHTPDNGIPSVFFVSVYLFSAFHKSFYYGLFFHTTHISISYLNFLHVQDSNYSCALLAHNSCRRILLLQIIVINM